MIRIVTMDNEEIIGEGWFDCRSTMIRVKTTSIDRWFSIAYIKYAEKVSDNSPQEG